jgi:ubiquinone/menaquinone biosynthesis C-methylase UbiE
MEELKSKLSEISQMNDEYWMNVLSERKKTELEFHDRHRNWSEVDSLDQDTYERFYGNKKYYSATSLSKSYVDRWIGREGRGRVFLDYCCGDGSIAIRAAKAGAALAIGLDLSVISIENARENAEKEDVSQNTCFVQADAENTMLPDDSIERIMCSGVLHHLDLSHAFPEMQRILVPGGKVLAIEALDYNPAIKLYRHFTPEMRTEWEKAHILSLKDIVFAKKFFSVGEIRFWHILSILEPHMRVLAPILHKIDTILTKIPLIRLMSWMFTFELIKQDK